LTSTVFANEDCTYADYGLALLLMATKTNSDMQRIWLRDCKERPYVFVFKKLKDDDDNVSEFLEIFNDTIFLEADKITKENTIRELSEDELKLYPKNKIKKHINEYSDTTYYIDTIYYDTIWVEKTTKKGYLDKWASEKPFFSALSLDDFSKRQWLFESEYLFPNEVSLVSKQDLKLKLQGKGFRDEIETLLSYADKDKIGIYYYKSIDKTPYALVVAKRKYGKYISGEFFNK